MRIYLGPALLDWLIFLVLFAVLYSAGARGFSTTQCAWLGGVFQLCYMLTSLLAGFVITNRNARRLVLASTAVSGVMGVVCLWTQDFRWLLPELAVLSVAMAFFFNAFQAFMRNETIPGGLAWTVGVYNLAWSLGAGGGVLSSGLVYRFGPLALSAVTLTVSGIILGALLTYHPRNHRRDGVEAEEHVPGARAPAPIYVVIGWLIIFTSMFIQRPLHTYFPKISAEAGTSAAWAGIPLFGNMLIQGLAGLAMAKLPRALYRRLPLVIFQGAGVLICWGLLWRPENFVLTFFGVSLLGVCSGAACFLSVYFASNSGNRAFNIGINEFLVGLGSFAGLWACEWRINATDNNFALYEVFAAAFAVSTLLQLALATWRGPKAAVKA